MIADEAHRVAGKNENLFQTVLSDHTIKSQRRLFATATPRIYRTGLKKAAEELGVEVVDKNDEKSFGKRFHTLTFGEAIKRELLTDYRVLIVGVEPCRQSRAQLLDLRQSSNVGRPHVLVEAPVDGTSQRVDRPPFTVSVNFKAWFRDWCLEALLRLGKTNRCCAATALLHFAIGGMFTE